MGVLQLLAVHHGAPSEPYLFPSRQLYLWGTMQVGNSLEAGYKSLLQSRKHELKKKPCGDSGPVLARMAPWYRASGLGKGWIGQTHSEQHRFRNKPFFLISYLMIL